MKTTQEGHGGTVPGALGAPIRRDTRELSDAEKRSMRRQVEEMSRTEGGYRIWTDSEGHLHSEPLTGSLP